MGYITTPRMIREYSLHAWRKTGIYYSMPSASRSFTASYTVVNNILLSLPFIVARPQTLEALAIKVLSSIAGAGSVARLGVYSDDGNVNPSAVLTDAGEVSLVGTGIKEITGMSQAMPVGLYWLTVFLKLTSGAAGLLNMQGGTVCLNMLGFSTTAASHMTVSATATYGTLPLTHPGGTLSGAIPPMFCARFSA